MENFRENVGQLMSNQGPENPITQKMTSESEFVTNDDAGVAGRDKAAAMEILRKLLESRVYKELTMKMPKIAKEVEAIIDQACTELQGFAKSIQQMETNFSIKTDNYHQSVEHAYEQLDNKISMEEESSKQRIEQKSEQILADYKQILATKTEQLNEIQQKLTEVSSQIEVQQEKEEEDKAEIENIQRTFEMLYESVEETEQMLEKSKQTIEDLQMSAKLANAKREQADASTCTRVQLECEALMRQLDQLRETNRRLRDERDEALHEHRLQDLIAQGSLQDEVNEVFGHEFEAGLCRTMEPDTSIPDTVLSQTVTTNKATDRQYKLQEANSLQPLTSEFFDEDYEFETPWEEAKKNPVNTIDYMTNGISYSLGAKNTPRHHSTASSRKEELGKNNDIIEDYNCKSGTVEILTFKVLVLGAKGVGKSTVLDKGFGSVTDALDQGFTYVTVRSSTLQVDGIYCMLHLWELPIDKRIKDACIHLMRTVDGIILLYDVNSAKQFQQLEEQVSTICDLKKKQTEELHSVNLLLGNKVDLLADLEKMPVSKAASNKLAQKMDATSYLVSGLTGENLDGAFIDFVKRLQLLHKSKMTTDCREIEPTGVSKTFHCFACCCM